MRSAIQSLEFDRPTDWTDVSMLSFVAPKGKAFRANILVTHERHSGSDPMVYAREQSSQLAKGTKGFVSHRLEKAEVGGLPGVVSEHSFTSDEGLKLRQAILTVIRAGTVYSVSLTQEESKFAAERPQFDRMVQTLTFRD